jgi:methyltransferase (TIGR00027 family)
MPGRPSRTAFKIAAALVALEEDPRGRILPPGVAETTRRLLVAGGVLPSWERTLLQSRAYAGLLRWVERGTVPGLLAHIAVRKRFFEDSVRQALEAGARQLLVLGAGYDTLALRMARERSDVTCIELDTGPTTESKRRCIHALGPRPPNLHLVSAELDLLPLHEVCAGLPAWRPSQPAVVVAEGLLMYLPERAVRSCLEAIRASAGPGSRLVFSYLMPDSRGRPEMGRLGWLTRASLRLAGEPLRWSIQPAALGAFLEAHGYRLLAAPAPRELRARYLDPLGLREELAGVERLALAGLGGHESV